MPTSPYRTNIQVRFGDTDALGHLNNASFAAYVEVARLDFLAALGKSVRSLILANLCIDYRRQVGPDEAVHVETWVEKLGTASMSLAHTVFANGERAADVRSVVVHFDYAANKSQPLTAEMRERLQPYVC